MSALAPLAEGVIALTGGIHGPIDCALREGRGEIAASRLKRLADAFGDRLYVEVQRPAGKPEGTESALLDLAYAERLPIVGTSEPFFGKPEDYDAHDALLAIAEGRIVSDGERRRISEGQFFASRTEMIRRFSDLPEAIESTLEIALRCAWRTRPRKPILPRYPTEEGRDEAAELRAQAEAGLAARLAAHPLAEGFTERTTASAWISSSPSSSA